MKEKLVTSETTKSINQDIMSIYQKLDVISEDLKQIKTRLLLNSFSTERIVHHPLNYYIAEDKMLQFKDEIYSLCKRDSKIGFIDNLNSIRLISINKGYGHMSEVFTTIMNNLNPTFIDDVMFKHDLSKICFMQDASSDDSFKNAYYHAINKLKNSDF